ncbi:DUF3331 domain-containing protein [Paraburkholderia tropica]|uniref:DUF3331 domain-containing protein n=1 Tax=Paraburkholderia tropica TaxID=92647 RepID=UPI002AB71A02|nr:DUF3331 domain-containing protein [Paraburkholderia tropica]
MKSRKEGTRWAAALALLDVAMTRRALDAVVRFSAQRPETEHYDHSIPTVRLIERLDDETVLLSWSDPLFGHRCEETWKQGIARRSGWCALTFSRIRRGDPVYHPARSSSRNLNAMIIAIRVDAALIGESLAAPTIHATESALLDL